MALSRITAIVLLSAVLLAACGDADSPSAPAATAGPTATPDAAVAWANGVCSASTALRASVQDVGAALQVQPSGSETSLDQMRTEVRGRVTAVQQSAASLDSALSAVPAGADPELAAARQELQTASQRAQSAVEQLGAAAGKVADAGTPAEAAAGLPGLKAALTGTANDLQAYLESLRTTVNGGEEAIRSSFGAAPACKDVAATP